MPLWLNGGGIVIGDGGLILCEECPCPPPTQTLMCGSDVEYILPGTLTGFFEVVVSGFTGTAANWNGTYVVASNTFNVVDPWETGFDSFSLSGGGTLGIFVTPRNFNLPDCWREVRLTQNCGFGSFTVTFRAYDVGPVTVDQTAAMSIPNWGWGGTCHASSVQTGAAVTYRCYS